MNREKAWSHYFTTGDREPLIKAYWKSINYIAAFHFPRQQEDMFQIGLIGLLKAIDKIDPKRVKSFDAWVWLKVRSAMFQVTQPKETISFGTVISDRVGKTLTIEDTLSIEVDYEMIVDVKDAIMNNKLDSLSNYEPAVITDQEKVLGRYQNGELSRRGVERELGISARQAYKLIGTMPESW